MSIPTDTDIKAKVSEAIQTLPENASWDDVMYRIYVRQKIENGLKDVAAGNTLSVEEVRKRFGLPE
jgi:predicted transcriptional regulator